MPDARTEHLIEIVGEAMRRPPVERAAYVRSACDDPEARREALSLLSALERAGPFMDRPTVMPGAAPVLRERPGTMVGRYELLEQIGEGGFGVVFRAEQREPVRREVALKIIKLGMDTAAVVARFEAERQTLALMDHPCIAKVLDGGATETGRPYFVMELVRGEPITRYSDRHSLDSRARLDLFVQVCRAVQHAHSKGIIHRDLKPGNVLVTEVDGRPVPRVIDFGIAKATATTLAGKAAFTEMRQFVGTPEYMSPEQSPGVDIDTRSDIYSLGVMLYELLTGVTPLDPARLRSAAWDQMLRMIREEDPPKPSTRLTAAGAAPGAPASRESAASLRGDLDWIIMRCLEKDRARRYQTADGLAADIERHVKGESVLAAPPSRAYQLRKFVGRHRGGVAAAGIALASLIAGLSVAVWQARIASHERDTAEARRHETEQVAAFQSEQLGGIDPRVMGAHLREDLLAADAAAGGTSGSSPALAPLLERLNLTDVALRTLDRNIFARAIAAIDRQFADQPAVRSDLLLTVSETMAGLGMLDAAQGPMQEAYSQRRHDLGDDDPATLQAQVALSSLLLQRGKLTEADGLLTDALARVRRVAGPDHPIAIDALHDLGLLRASQNRLKESEQIDRETLERTGRVLGPDHPSTLSAELNLGVTLQGLGHSDQAEAHFRRAYERMQALHGPDHRDTIKAKNNLANCLRLQRRFAEAEPLLRETLQTMRQLCGERHPDTLSSMDTLAQLLLSRKGPGDLEQAGNLMEELIEGRRATLGPRHLATLEALYILGEVRCAQGDNERAQAPLREALDGFTALGAGSGPQAVMTRLQLGRALIDLRRYADAEPLLLDASRILAAGHGGAGAGRGPGGRDPSAQDLFDLYTAWDSAEPGKGHDVSAAKWRDQLPRSVPQDPASNRRD